MKFHNVIINSHAVEFSCRKNKKYLANEVHNIKVTIFLKLISYV